MKSALLIALAALAGPFTARPLHAEREGAEVRAAATARTRHEIEARIARFGGRDAIRAELEPLRAEVERILADQASEPAPTFQVGRKSFHKDITALALKPSWDSEWNPCKGEFPARDVIVDFDRQLERYGIDLIVVPVPSKIEAYAHLFDAETRPGLPIGLGRLEQMLYLLDHGVEVIDVLPAILSLMTEDDATPLYETDGHHVSGLGVRHLGALVADRLARHRFEERDHARFTDVERTAADRMRVWEVHQDGRPYEHSPVSPVVVVGDSNALTFGRASWASHVARAAGLPVTDLSRRSGGPTAHARLAAQGTEMLRQRRVVVWILTATALEHRPWRRVTIPRDPQAEGLLTAKRAGEFLALLAACDDDLSRMNVREFDVDGLAKELARAGELEQARRLFEINTELFPGSANAFASLGPFYARIGETEKAIACLEKVLTLNPKPETRERSARLLARLGVEPALPATHELSLAALEALVGVYDLDGNNTGVVTRSNGRLVFEYAGRGAVEMRPLSDHRFATDVGFEIRFVPASDGGPPAVVLHGPRRSFEGRKRE